MTAIDRTGRRRGNLSNEQVLAAYAELRPQGLLNKQIARQLDIHIDTLAYHLTKARKAGDPRAATVDRAARAAAVARLTEQQGSLASIGTQLGIHRRTVGRIRARLRTQGAAA